MKYKLSFFPLTILFLLLFSSCAQEPSLPASGAPHTGKTQEASVTLRKTEDFGQEYIDSFIFLGESTTYHMKSRGVLKDGTKTKQVWAPESGTLSLDTTTPSAKLFYPDTGEYLTLREAVSRKQPEYIVLTFGLNGAVQNVKKGEEYYKSCYRLLLDDIRNGSPNTKIILQSGFPVASNMDMRYYSISLKELNEYIDIINAWVLELAEEYNLRYLNTSEILKDSDGCLKFEYQCGDGYHLTREAYVEILNYIRTHGYTD